MERDYFQLHIVFYTRDMYNNASGQEYKALSLLLIV